MGNNLVIAGSLDFLNLADLLQLLGSSGGTGELHIKSKYAQSTGRIYFKDGNPIDASDGSNSGEKAIYALFGWTEGEFEFYREPVAVTKVIQKNRMEIILDGLRLLDDGKIKKLGPVSFTEKKTEEGTAIPLIRGPLLDYMYVIDEEEFYSGEDIVSQGSHGNWLWVILEGVVEIVKETSQGRLPILRVGDGCFIGSLASFAFTESMRSATAVAVGNVQLGMIDSQQISNEFARLTSDFRGFILSLDKRLKEVTNRVVDFHQAKDLKNAYIKGRKAVIKQGDTSEKLLRVNQGNVTVVRQVDKSVVPLAQLTEGDYFGYIPFLNIGHEPHSASVLARKGLKAARADIDAFTKEYDQLSQTFKNIVENLATCISATTMVASNIERLKS